MAWQEQARTLALGQRRKVAHCDTKPSAYISNGPRGVSLHCFRCNTNEFEPHGRLSASDILAMRKHDEEERSSEYPDVRPLAEAPTEAHVWLLKAGITPERASERYGFGWSPRSNRVIIPVLHNGEPTGGWIGRAVDGRAPKYLMPKGSDGTSWYQLQRDRTPYACVVEDVLSAIKVAEAGCNSCAVLGTSVGPAQAMLLADYDVIGWFDGDKAGRNGFVKLRKALGPFGATARRIKTPRDPKTYSHAEIKQFIEGAT